MMNNWIVNMEEQTQVQESEEGKLGPKEWLEDIMASVKEATGSDMFGDDSKIKDAALFLVTILSIGSVKDEDLREATGLGLGKIQMYKKNMRTSGLLHSHQGVRVPTIQFSDWDADFGWMSLLLDAMATAGIVVRVAVPKS